MVSMQLALQTVRPPGTACNSTNMHAGTVGSSSQVAQDCCVSLQQ